MYKQGPVHSHHVDDIRYLAEHFYHLAVMAHRQRVATGGSLGHWDGWHRNKYPRHTLHVLDVEKNDNAYDVTLCLNGVDRATMQINNVQVAQHDGSELTFTEPRRVSVELEQTAHDLTAVNRSDTSDVVQFESRFVEIDGWSETFRRELGAAITTTVGVGSPTSPVSATLGVTLEASETTGWDTSGSSEEHHKYEWNFDVPGLKNTIETAILPRIKDSAPTSSHIDPANAPREDWATAVLYKAECSRSVGRFEQTVSGFGGYTIGSVRMRSNEKWGSDKWNWYWGSQKYMRECMQGFHGNSVWEHAVEEHNWEKMERTLKAIPINFTYQFVGASAVRSDSQQVVLGRGESSNLLGYTVTG